MRCGLVAVCGGLAVVWVPAWGAVIIGTLLLAIGYSLLFPCVTALVTRSAEDGGVGAVLGVQQALGGGSKVIAPIVAGSLLAGGPSAAFGFCWFITAAATIFLPSTSSSDNSSGRSLDDRMVP